MNETEIIAALGITAERFAEWRDAGMPYTGRKTFRKYDPAAVRQWLIETGRAKPIRLVASLAEVGAYFGVSERSAASLRAAGMPGEPGAYDLDAIEAWRGDKRTGTAPDEDSARARQANADAGFKELRTAKMAGQLYEVDVAQRRLTRLLTEAMTILESLPDRVLAKLPTAAPSRKHWSGVRRDIRAEINALVGAVRTTLEELPRAKEFGGSEEEGGDLP